MIGGTSLFIVGLYENEVLIVIFGFCLLFTSFTSICLLTPTKTKEEIKQQTKQEVLNQILIKGVTKVYTLKQINNQVIKTDSILIIKNDTIK